MFILNVLISSVIAIGISTAATLLLRESNIRRERIPTTSDGLGTDSGNNNVTFGPPRQPVPNPFFLS